MNTLAIRRIAPAAVTMQKKPSVCGNMAKEDVVSSRNMRNWIAAAIAPTNETNYVPD